MRRGTTYAVAPGPAAAPRRGGWSALASDRPGYPGSVTFPGSAKFPVVGMVGGGQLARMTHQAGIPLGVRFKLLADTPQDSASQVVSDVVLGDYRDLETLRASRPTATWSPSTTSTSPPSTCALCRPTASPSGPARTALVNAQDKGVMRATLDAIGVPCPRHRLVADPADVTAFAEEGAGYPVVLKTVRGGYDGKGVWVVDDEEQAHAPFLAGVAVLAEEKVDYLRELAANVVRSPSGQAVAYPVVESLQENGVCAEVIAPAPDLDPVLAGGGPGARAADRR